MIYPVVAELASGGLAVAACCRVLGVSASGFYEWRARGPSARQLADEQLTAVITQIHELSRGSYGAPRVHAELQLGRSLRCGRKRVERLMRAAGLAGIYRRRSRGCTVTDPAATPHPDLVNRQFTATGPDRLWLTDITQHRTGQGWLYCAAVLDVFSRRVVGWSIADQLRTELVTDALDMARWRRKPPVGTVLHSDHGCQYTSWSFGQRLRDAGLLGSMGSIGDCYDNSMMESFFGTMQLELLDRKTWATRQELASAIFEWIEAWYNPALAATRRSPTAAPLTTRQCTTRCRLRQHDHHKQPVRETGGSSRRHPSLLCCGVAAPGSLMWGCDAMAAGGQLGT
jgi:putative transposase